MSLHENHVKENLHELNFNQIPYLVHVTKFYKTCMYK